MPKLSVPLPTIPHNHWAQNRKIVIFFMQVEVLGLHCFLKQMVANKKSTKIYLYFNANL